MAAGSKEAIARRPGVQTKDDDPNFTLGLNAEMRELLALDDSCFVRFHSVIPSSPEEIMLQLSKNNLLRMKLR